MLYQERIVDLGPHGLLALTLDSGSYPPLPARRHGYAEWHALDGGRCDRLGLCSRHLPREALVEGLEEMRARYARAVASVRGHVEWVFGQVSDDYLESPSDAASLGDGLVVLLFSESARPASLRIVDVVNDRVLVEESAEDLRRRLGAGQPQYDLDFRGRPYAPVLYAAGSRHMCISVGLPTRMLVLKDGRLEVAETVQDSSFDDAAFARDALYLRNRETSEVRVMSLESGLEIARFRPVHSTDGWAHVQGAGGSDRCAIGHEGGTVDIVDSRGTSIDAFRPLPRLGRNKQLRISLSHSGRFIEASYWKDSSVVDIEAGVVAMVDMPPGDEPADRLQFTPEICFRSDFRAIDEGVASLYRRALTIARYRDLDWQPAVRPRKPGRREQKASKPMFTKMLERWRKPALSLKPALSREPGRSKLYGSPWLPDGVAWPEHKGKRMQLLCQLDLAEVAARIPQGPLPGEGALMFFVALDGEGEPLLDDEFNPVATRVIWVAGLGDRNEEECSSRIAVQGLQLDPDPSQLPSIDAAIVEARLLSDPELEQYREFIEEQLPGGATDGHRIGGYPRILQNNDLEATAEYRANGDYPTASQEGFDVAARWRLLLQLDSDGEFMWGTDSGMLYFMIHDEDLARRDFSRVVAISEGC